MNRMMEQLESERDRVEEVFCLVDNIRHGRACGVSVIVWKTTCRAVVATVRVKTI